MYSSHSIHESILDFFNTYPFLKSSVILVAFSGGTDSTVLLNALNENQKKTDITIVTAYFDHALRGEKASEEEKQHVENETAKLNIPLYMKKLTQGYLYGEAKRKNRSLEDLAREYRYEFFYNLSENLQESFNKKVYIALGHHQDDSIETALMRFIQGSGVTGLCGIPPVNGKIIRPLIDVNKSAINEYLNQNSIYAIHDITNQNVDFLRNRIRHKLIPLLEAEYPGYKKSIKQGIEKYKIAEDYLQNSYKERLKWEFPFLGLLTGTCLNIKASDFISAPEALRLYGLYDAFDRLITESQGNQLAYRFIRPLLFADSIGELDKIIGGELKGHGLNIQLRNGYLEIHKDLGSLFPGEFICKVTPGILEAGVYSVKIEFTKRKTEGFPDINIHSFQNPLFLSSPLPKDSIKVDTRRCLLKDLFTRQKIPLHIRNKIPVLKDRNEIKAVFTGAFGGEDVFAEKITVQKGINRYTMKKDNYKYCYKISGIDEVGSNTGYTIVLYGV